MQDCIFCKIVKGDLPARFEKETESLVAFKDVNPKAPVHILIIPKNHVQDIRELDEQIWSEIRRVAIGLAREHNLTGYRLVTNIGEAAAIAHMHMHLLGSIDQNREV